MRQCCDAIVRNNHCRIIALQHCRINNRENRELFGKTDEF